MSAERENGWLGTLSRQAGIRRLLVVHGNVADVCWSESRQEYRTVLDVVDQDLREKGFEEVGVWDRHVGFQGLKPDTLDSLRRGSAFGGQQAAPGEEYAVNRSVPEPRGAAIPDPAEFFSIVHHALLTPTPRRLAFVLDGAEYLFGDSRSASEAERQWLLTLARSLRRAATPLDAQSLSKPLNLLVLMTSRLTSIPAACHHDNPAAAEVLVPMPGRPEREGFMNRMLGFCSLDRPLRAGTADFADFVDSLDGLRLKDLQNLIRLSRQVDGQPLAPAKLVNLYKYGERSSPWESLNREKLARLQEELQRWVKGQNHAIERVRRVLVRAFTGLSGLHHSHKQKGPKGVLFFVGPTGVGKTELAKAMARFLFGDEDAFIRFDMSEYNHEHSDQRLVGAPPGYVGHEDGGQLTNAVKRRPFSVLLFDEIEKAHGRILDKFLQILEDGRLTDGRGQTASFSETVIIFTSNIGASEVAVSNDEEQVRVRFTEMVRKHFVEVLGRPELLNRIGDNIVPFNFIQDEATLIAIARAKLAPLRDFLKEKYKIEEIAFQDESKALGAIVKGARRENGGRGILNDLVTHLFDPLSDFLFDQVDGRTVGRALKVLQVGTGPRFEFRLE